MDKDRTKSGSLYFPTYSVQRKHFASEEKSMPEFQKRSWPILSVLLNQKKILSELHGLQVDESLRRWWAIFINYIKNGSNMSQCYQVSTSLWSYFSSLACNMKYQNAILHAPRLKLLHAGTHWQQNANITVDWLGILPYIRELLISIRGQKAGYCGWRISKCFSYCRSRDSSVV